MIYQFCCYCKLYNSIFISFLVYRKTINFCILTLYSVTMLCLFIYFLGSILWDFLHRQSHHLWTQTFFFFFPVFEENIVFLILKHILTAFYTNGSMWHQGRLIFCHLLGLVLRTEIKALMKGEVWKVAFLRDKPYNGVMSMFSLKFYLGSNRETSRGLQAMGVFFVHLIDSWNCILKSRFADYNKLPWQRKPKVTGAPVRGCASAAVLLLHWLPLIILPHRALSSGCLECQHSPEFCPCPSCRSPLLVHRPAHLLS